MLWFVLLIYWLHLTKFEAQAEKEKPYFGPVIKDFSKVLTRTTGEFYVRSAETYPYQASIRELVNGNLYHFCGGVIISPSTVLSSGFCLFKYAKDQPVRIVVGELNIALAPKPENVYHIAFVNNHNYFRFPHHDIAVIGINGTFNFSKSVGMIARRKSPPKVGTNCVVSGWGYTEYGLIMSRYLVSVVVPILELDLCKFNFAFFNSGLLCVGYIPTQFITSQGDSGGPLVCDGVLAGSVCGTLGCSNHGKPAIYTEVSYFEDWINKNMKQASNKLNSSQIMIVCVLLLLKYL